MKGFIAQRSGENASGEGGYYVCGNYEIGQRRMVHS